MVGGKQRGRTKLRMRQFGRRGAPTRSGRLFVFGANGKRQRKKFNAEVTEFAEDAERKKEKAPDFPVETGPQKNAGSRLCVESTGRGKRGRRGRRCCRLFLGRGRR